MLSDYTVHVAKQFSKDLEKAQYQSGLISDWNLGCSVMTPHEVSSLSIKKVSDQTLSLCTSCHFEGRGV